ncbi:glycoside hydrolase [Kribbella sp. NPDC050124]|uniref:GH39 family glycosyl hydrolase n=1 Tax=Kribbella sp. NPDC050124 TaxID=3364114 RepID=UPI0037AECF6F
MTQDSAQNASPSDVQRLPYAPSDPSATPLRTARVTVDAASDAGVLDRPWASLGYDEINWTYTPQGRRTLQTIGRFAETPYHVRPHNIFNSGTGLGLPHWGSGNVYHEDADGKPYYDFTIADLTYDAIVGAGHHPLVELAFTPLALVPESAKAEFPFENSPSQYSAYEAGWWSYPPKDYARWGGLVAALVEHCLERYGADEVKHWLWELWNEPDISYWRGTPQQFHDLYDVTVKAIRDVYPEARVGGPAVTGGDRGAVFLHGFLQACADRDLPVDFVSFHTKGSHFTPWRTYGPIGAPAPEQQSPSTPKMLREIDRALRVIEQFPQYVDAPVIVDECDASVPAHWGIYDNANFAYRNNEYYPVFQAKLMKKVLDLNAQHAAKVREATTWSFSMEGERYFEGTRSFVTASGIEKPLMNAYRAFAHLGDRRLAATSDQSADVSDISALGNGLPEEVDVVASRSSSDGSVAILVWRHTDDQYADGKSSTRVDLEVSGLETGAWTAQHYRIDHSHSNSHTVWQDLGAPQDPTPDELAKITSRQGLERFTDDSVVQVDGVLGLHLELPLPSLSLVILTKVA